MEMEVNWSKPNVVLSLRDTQQSPSYSFKQNAQSNSYRITFTLIALYTMQSA
jgi:hypothetical protein